jgi:predicted dienelactone hydrolase
MSDSPRYDPAGTGQLAVRVRTIDVRDGGRGRTFPVELWYPADAAGLVPLVMCSHRSGGDRRNAGRSARAFLDHGATAMLAASGVDAWQATDAA